MPQHGPRKRRTREHIIADLSVNYVEKCVLLCGWTIQRMTHDYGIDLLMTTFNRSGEIETGEVRFQLKATDSLETVSRRNAIAIRVEWRDVIYWLNERMPVILVVYDAKKDRAWWLNVQANVREESIRKRRATPIRLTLHLPLGNVLNPAAIREIATIRDLFLA
jgi:Domain of unknown function (DUF4365)